MAVSSLNKFTVPLASDQSASTQGLLMPKLKYRFRVSFENFGITTPRSELTKQVIDFMRPSVSQNRMEIPIYNSRVYLAGKPEWEATQVNLRDDAQGNVSKLVGEQMQKQYDFMEQSSAASGIDYKFITRCEILDGGNGAFAPTTLETWELYGCFLTSVAYGEVSYGSDEPVTLQMSISFDNAVQTPLGTGLGTTVGRTVGQTITG
jgi:hypothetical protein